MRQEHPDHGHAHHCRGDPGQNAGPTPLDIGPHHRSLRGQQNDHHHQRYGHNPVDHGTPEQCLDRIDRRKLKDQCCQQTDGNHTVETNSIGGFSLQSPAPAHRFRQGIGPGARQYRHSDQTGAQNPQGKEQEGKIPSQRTQGLGCFCSSFDITNTSGVKGERGAENDEVSGEIGKEHSTPTVPGHPTKLPFPEGSLEGNQRCIMLTVEILHLLGGLPKEEVGADGGAKDRDHNGSSVGIQTQTRPEGTQHHLCPRHVDGEHNCPIGQQREGEPLQITDVIVVGNKDLQQQCHDHKQRGHLQIGEASNEMGRFTHRHHISCNVEGIGK